MCRASARAAAGPEARENTPAGPGTSRCECGVTGVGVPKVYGSGVSEPERATAISHGPGEGDWLRSGMLFAAKVPVPAVRNTGDRHRRTAWRSQSPAPLPPQGARINRNAYKKVRCRDLQTARKYMHTHRSPASPELNATGLVPQPSASAWGCRQSSRLRLRLRRGRQSASSFPLRASAPLR
jgi:hypothetical protein